MFSNAGQHFHILTLTGLCNNHSYIFLIHVELLRYSVVKKNCVWLDLSPLL